MAFLPHSARAPSCPHLHPTTPVMGSRMVITMKSAQSRRLSNLAFTWGTTVMTMMTVKATVPCEQEARMGWSDG